MSPNHTLLLLLLLTLYILLSMEKKMQPFNLQVYTILKEDRDNDPHRINYKSFNESVVCWVKWLRRFLPLGG